MTQKEEWNKRNKQKADTANSKKDIAKISKVPIKVLDTVYDRGLAAHKNNPASVRVKGTYKKDAKAPISKKLSAPQWAMARVYAFVNKLEGKRKLNQDKDLVAKIPKYKNKNIDKL
tara:strand:- start:267 stop:614 length:348 start_codon:yes stop_codon:yes gene_type:complete